MKFDVLHNFISPVTGRVLSDTDYILLGDNSGIAQPSPILIDMRLDIIELKHSVSSLEITSFILGFPNDDLPNAQVLSILDNGFIYNTEGIISTSALIPIESLPDLAFNKIWVGDLSSRPVESGILYELVVGPEESVVPLNVVIWDDSSGRHIRDSGYNIAALAAIGTAAGVAADAATDAAAAAVVAAAAAGAAAAAALAASLAAGADGAPGAPGFGFPGFPGTPGAAGASGKETLIISSNLSLVGGRVQDIAPSPEADYDAVSSKWVWDLLNDNVEIKWE
jgi:hypothetical protein